MDDNLKFPKGQYVLLAEDDPDDQMLFSDAFHEVNNIYLDLLTVNDGKQLMDFLCSSYHNLPRLVFLDLNMPLKDGYECLLEIKGNENLSTLPVIIYTTAGTSETIEKLREAKAHLYVTKPRNFSRLKQIIHKVLVSDFVSNLSEPRKDHFLLFSEE